MRQAMISAIICAASILFSIWQTYKSWRYYQRHKVRMALLRRCDVYIERQKQLRAIGNHREAHRLYLEVDELLAQIKESLSKES